MAVVIAITTRKSNVCSPKIYAVSCTCNIQTTQSFLIILSLSYVLTCTCQPHYRGKKLKTQCSSKIFSARHSAWNIHKLIFI